MSNEKITETVENIETTEKVVETTETAEKSENKKGKKVIALILVFTLIIGAGIGFYFYWQSTSYISTGNARVTTNLIPIVAPAVGTLDRFTVSEGSYVEENEVIGRVDSGGFLRSPVDGVVVNINAVLNQVVSPQVPVAVIADINNIHIRANIEETHISRLHIGQTAYVTIDALGNRQFIGYIYEIGRVTDAELSGNAMFFNTGGTFTRVTQLLPVRIRITDDIYLNNLIGLNANVRIPLR